LALLQGTIQTERHLVFDWRLSARAFDGGAIGSEVLQRWTFGYVDLVPSTAFVVVFVLSSSSLSPSPTLDVDKSDPDPNFWEQQRRFVGSTWDVGGLTVVFGILIGLASIFVGSVSG
jgi:hypothetical protein